MDMGSSETRNGTDLGTPLECVCLICDSIVQSPRTETRKEDSQQHHRLCTLSRLIRYRNITGTHVSTPAAADSYHYWEDGHLLTLCPPCQIQLQEMEIIINQLEELSRKVTQFQQHIKQQMNSLDLKNTSSMPAGSMVANFRQRLLKELDFVSPNPDDLKPPEATEAEILVPLPLHCSMKPCVVKIVRMDDMQQQTKIPSSPLVPLEEIQIKEEFEMLNLDQNEDSWMQWAVESDLQNEHSEDEEFVLPDLQTQEHLPRIRERKKRVTSRYVCSSEDENEDDEFLIRTTAGSKKYQARKTCQFPGCQFKSIRNSQIQRHVQKCHFRAPMAVFMCWRCGANFPAQSSLLEGHLLKHQEYETRFPCKLCHMKYHLLCKLRAHYRKRHPKVQLPVRKDFPKAVRMHKQINAKSVTQVRKLLQKHSASDKKKTETQKDKEASALQKSRRPRLRKKKRTQEEIGMKTCQVCQKEIPVKRFQYHVSHHRTHKCPVIDCSATFRTAKTLRTHKIRCHPELKVPAFQCAYCTFTTFHKGALKEHEDGQHSKGTKVSCPYPDCKFVTPRKCRLRPHIEAVHEGKTKFLCTECGKAFYHQNNLTCHMRSHTGERPYACTFCDKRFMTSRDWKRHEGIHSSERPFECKLCGVRFPTQNNLAGHLYSWHKGGTQRIGVQPIKKSKYSLDELDKVD